MAERQSKTGWMAWMVAAGVLATALAGAGAAVMALQARAANETALPERPPLTVTTERIAMVDRYTLRERFLGRVEPARETRLAAERNGLLTAVMVEEGDRVAAGQVLAALDTRPLEITRDRLLAERASLEADIALAERTTDRRARLVGEGWTSGQAYDEARFSISALEARRAAVGAEIAQVDLDLEKSTVTAPFAGTIAARLVDDGTVLAAGTPIVALQETGRPQARIGLPSDRAAALDPGDAVTLDYLGRTLTGRVAAITLDLEAGTRTVPVLVDVEADGPLAMGQVIRLALDRAIEARGAWVPLAALTEAERGLWSLMTVVGAEGGALVAREAVEILHLEGERAFVRGTFADGARVIGEGSHRVGAGQAVALADD